MDDVGGAEAAEDLVGRTGEPFTLPVELGKVREFVRATKARHPAYREEDAVVPPTFPQVMAFWTNRDSDPWSGVPRNWERILHGEQEFVYHGEPPHVGDVLTGTTRIDRVYRKEGKRGGSMTFTESVTELRDASGRLVAESRTVGIETSRATGEG
jgi:hypothetical protein